MNILLLCTKYSLTDADAWLTNELADALARSGHLVQVVCINWNAKPGEKDIAMVSSSGVKALIVSPFSVKKMGEGVQKTSKWILSSIKARSALKKIITGRQFDLVIGFSPAVTIMAALLRALKQPHIISYYILWDFFPYHHHQIGLIKNRPVFLIAKKIEEYIIRKFNFIACMSEMNVNYLKTHYNLKSNQKTIVLPLWGSPVEIEALNKKSARDDLGLPLDKVIAVFGGQLNIGRGIEEILSVAKIAQQAKDDIIFLFIGSGPYLEMIRDSMTSESNNIIAIDWTPRNQYLRLLSVCDIALVCTVRNVDVPTFPSKTIDYFQASLPIVASVEISTDYGSWLVKHDAGYCSEAGDTLAFYKNIKKMSDNPQLRSKMGKNGNDCLGKEMNVFTACDAILESALSTIHGN